MKTDQAEIHFKRNQNTVLFFDVLVLSPPRRTVLSETVLVLDGRLNCGEADRCR